MDQATLQAFVSVCEHRSFTLAADALQLTQPAVSKRIALLEQELNVSLFDRVGRQVRLTEHGQSLLPRAKQILQQIDETRRELAETADTVSGALSLAISHHIGLHRLPPVLKEFNRRYPGVRLDMTFTDSEIAYSQVLSGDIELAVNTLAPQEEAQIVSATIWIDPLCFAAAPTHELCQLKRPGLSELAEHPAIIAGRNTYTGQMVLRLFAERGHVLQIGLATNYLETIKVMAAVGLGWTVIPETMLDESLHKLDIRDVRLERKLGFIHHRKRRLSNAAKAFLALLESPGD